MTIRPIRPADAAVIAGWRYSARYPGSDFSEGDLAALLEPTNLVHVIESETGLEGMFGFGAMAREPGTAPTADVIDLGFARAPDRVGRGEGGRFLAAILTFIEDLGARVTVRAVAPELNAPCCRLLAGAGFTCVRRNWQPGGGTTLVYTLVVDPRRAERVDSDGGPAGPSSPTGPVPAPC